MSSATSNINEDLAQEAFSKQSVIFDDIYSGNTIVNYKRDRVRQHVLKYIKAGGKILELNAGTGDDALFFAQQGFMVHATDISAGMQQQLKQKMKRNDVRHKVTQEICSYTHLSDLQNKGPFDHIFSNFAGLNCTGELDKVLASFNDLLNPGGVATLVILPKFCLWETLLVFKGKFKTAFRRWFSKNGVKAHLEGTYFKCYYYDPSYVANQLKDQFDLLSIEGLCTIVPPSYIGHFAERYLLTYRKLCQLEERVRFSRPWRSIGDYYIISMRKKAKS
jgi:ubiquinone/menaquinone biosynthesis C-methylase UbiE